MPPQGKIQKFNSMTYPESNSKLSNNQVSGNFVRITTGLGGSQKAVPPPLKRTRVPKIINLQILV